METRLRSNKLHIDGMSCISCQNKIEKKLRNTAGIETVSVSYNSGIANVTYDVDIIKLKEIETVIEKLGYQIVANNQRNQQNIGYTTGILAIIVSLYILLSQIGILNLLVPSQLADSKMGYGMLFVIGLITSIHCIAMCGGINLSQCIAHGEKGTGEGNRLQTFKPAFLYNLGRVISYTVVGFILGAIGFLFGGGTNVGLPVFVQGILKLIAGVFMVIMGINMLGIIPGLRKLQPQMPKFLAHKIGMGKAKSKSPLIVGLLNGLMPCGPLQSMQIVALASGNPIAGALSMFLFSLGTVPLMLGLGSIVSALGQKFTKKVMTVGAILVVVLGLAMLSQGGSLSGLLLPDMLMIIIIGLSVIGVIVSFPFKKQSYKAISTVATIFAVILLISALDSGIAIGSATADSSVDVNIIDGKQVINSTLSSGRYPNVTVQVGTPVKWIIDAPEGSVNGCNNQINIPEFDIERFEFKTGENVIEFTPTEVGKYQYSCWMGMIRGTITVTEAGDTSTTDTANESNIVENEQESTLPIPAGYVIPSEDVAVAKETLYQDEYPVQEVSIELTDEGFKPAVIVVKSGLTVVWNITNSASGDITQLLVPNYSTQVPLSSGNNQISFSPTDSFDFSTGDNAFYGYVKVVDDLESVDMEAVKSEVVNFETLIYPTETFQSGSGSSYDESQAETATIEDGVQYVTSTVSYSGYEPIRVREGIPVKWTINVPEDVLSSCNNSIYIPEYDLTVDLKAGDNLIEFTPDKSGNYVFSCWMGMVYGNIIVEREDGTVDNTQDDGSGSLPSCCG